MLPLYAARIEDLGRGDLVKVDCATCHHVALLTRGALLKLGLSPATKVLDLNMRVRCRGCGARWRAVVSARWGHPRVSRDDSPVRSGKSDAAYKVSPAFGTQFRVSL